MTQEFKLNCRLKKTIIYVFLLLFIQVQLADALCMAIQYGLIHGTETLSTVT